MFYISEDAQHGCPNQALGSSRLSSSRAGHGLRRKSTCLSGKGCVHERALPNEIAPYSRLCGEQLLLLAVRAHGVRKSCVARYGGKGVSEVGSGLESMTISKAIASLASGFGNRCACTEISRRGGQARTFLHGMI